MLPSAALLPNLETARKTIRLLGKLAPLRFPKLASHEIRQGFNLPRCAAPHATEPSAPDNLPLRSRLLAGAELVPDGHTLAESSPGGRNPLQPGAGCVQSDDSRL